MAEIPTGIEWYAAELGLFLEPEQIFCIEHFLPPAQARAAIERMAQCSEKWSPWEGGE